MYRLLNIVLLSLLIGGCGILDPWVYRIDKQQGNITEEKHVDKLEMGMTREQVKFVLGTPMSMDAFNQDRWDYIYTYKNGDGELTRNNLTIYFVDNKLNKIDGKALIKKMGKTDTDKKDGA